MDSLSECFQKMHASVFAAMREHLAEELGVSPASIEQLGVGYDYRHQAWVFAERNATGDIVGLSYRYGSGRKTMAPGFKQKRGLVYALNQDYEKGAKRYAPGQHNWARVHDVSVDCPVCGKPDGCLVSAENPSDPSAAICIRPEGKLGANADLGDSGHLHILKPEGKVSRKANGILPHSNLPILVVEGASDVLAAMSLGYVAIGRPSAQAGMELLSQMPLAGREVWIIGENDAGAGKEGMEKAYAVIHDLAKVTRCVMPPEGIKDLRAWYKTGIDCQALADYVAGHACDPVALNPDILQDGQPSTIARSFINNRFKRSDNITLKTWRGDWLMWDDGQYKQLEPGYVRGLIYAFMEGRSFVRETANGGRVVCKIPTTRKMSGDVLDCLNMPDLCPVDGYAPQWLTRTDMPDPKDLIVFKNGILDVNEYVQGRIKLYDSDPDLFVLNRFPYAFDENAHSQLCEDYWDEIFEGDDEVMRLLQQWFGYNLVPDTTQEKMMLFTGAPRSGKSTTLDTLRGMLGAEQCCALQMRNLIDRFGRQPMLGKLAATFGDTRTPRASEAAVALETLLQIIGQDPVSVDRKGMPELPSVKLFCRFTMAMNDLPAFSDHARALTPRLNIIYFPKSYVGKENRKLKPQLEAEAKSGKLINWALAGLKDLRTRGKFIEPVSSLEMFVVLENTTSPVTQFIRECCQTEFPGLVTGRDRGYFTCMSPDVALKEEMYEVWKAWCETSGRTPGLREQFGRWFLSARPKSKAVRLRDPENVRQYYYTHVAITPDARRKYLK